MKASSIGEEAFELHCFHYRNGGFQLGISLLPQTIARQFNAELWRNAAIFQHPSLPGQIGGNGQAQNVSMSNLEGASA